MAMLTRADLDLHLEVLERYRAGESSYALAQAYGVRDDTIRKWLKAFGPLRTRGEATKMRHAQDKRRCRRCGILLEQTEGSSDTLCGYCILESYGEYHHEPLATEDCIVRLMQGLKHL